MPFTRAQLEAYRDAAIPDLAGPGMRLLLCGINPGLWAAAAATHFAHPGNRFYPALAAAGILPRFPSIGDGMTDADRAAVIARGVGITSLVHRATARADELAKHELHEGAERLAENVALWQPRVVAIVGITAFRVAFDRPKAATGRQPETFIGAELWVVPNPSGLNAHDTVESLAAAYAGPARAAGVLPPADPPAHPPAHDAPAPDRAE
ncbi:MAG: mismatch-specific DNA-glycosylase [Actinomycetota bacterium]|nr:mismatch-specific DNA-glycosylase [Actinomycetota bacterium]